jgi:hypothetical protein
MPYIGRSSNFGVRTRFLYTATASQTTFSGTDTQNLTLSYSDSNFIDVHQNGVLLKVVDDYTATSGTSVVLATGATASDVIEITVYDVFSIANHIKKTGDAMAGALTNIDIDGTELILDADGDTSITADTDDQVDFKIGGTDRVSIAGANIKVLTGNIQFGASGSETGQIEINSTRLLLRSTGDASGLRFDGSAYTPFKNGSQADGTVDLGSSSGKYKDLYLSGGLYVGGTGSANQLDDYEEGTWTPTFVNFDGTMTINTNRYTKIGRLVTYELNVVVPSNSDGDAFQYTLPFTPSDNSHGAFVTFQEKGLEVSILGSNTGRHRLRDHSGNNRTFAQFSSSALYISGMFTI